MSSFTLSVRRAGALVAFALAATLLPGCVSYDSYYAEDRYGGDYYYGRADRYHDDYYWGAYAYDSVLWPTYRWYDPWYSPGYYYGINFSPNWYGLSLGYYGFGRRHHPWAYHHYSPYRYSWWDNHAWYGGTGWRHGMRDRYSAYRFGSARNEAERIAHAQGAAPRSHAPESYRGDGALGERTRGFGVPGGSRGDAGAPQRGNWSRGIDYGDGREARPADARDALRYDDAQRYSRYRETDPRVQGWRSDGGIRARDGATHELDGRTLGGGRPAYGRGTRAMPYDADAYSRSRDAAPYHDRATPRHEMREAPAQYASPRSGSFQGGGPSRPAAPQRSYDAPAYSPPARSDAGTHGRSDSSRQAERFSREPD